MRSLFKRRHKWTICCKEDCYCSKDDQGYHVICKCGKEEHKASGCEKDEDYDCKLSPDSGCTHPSHQEYGIALTRDNHNKLHRGEDYCECRG